MSNYIHQIINSKIDFLKSSYEANKLVKHQGIKGTLNEVLLHELIKNVIPRKYEFANGIIQDKKGHQSNESDLIIYDNEVLPAILFGSSLGFVPAESVKYNIEVKSTLNSKETKTTVDKFKNVRKCLGYNGVNALFSFSSDLTYKSDLERYYKIDIENFLQNPLIQVLLVMGEGYSFFSTEKMYLKNILGKNEFAKIANNQGSSSFEVDGLSIEINPEANINVKGDLIINGLNYEEIYVNIHRWYGTEVNTETNEHFLSFLSGISNTLSQGTFGEYLMANSNSRIKLYSECVIDMWGNISHNRIDFEGFYESDINKLRYSLRLREDGEKNKIEFYKPEI